MGDLREDVWEVREVFEVVVVVLLADDKDEWDEWDAWVVPLFLGVLVLESVEEVDFELSLLILFILILFMPSCRSVSLC